MPNWCENNITIYHDNQDILKKIQEEGDGIPSKSVTRIKEYDTEISKKLVSDLKKAFPELTQKQIGAIIGNLHHESAGFKRYQQVMGEGVSYAQWSGGRKKQFLKLFFYNLYIYQILWVVLL